MSPYTIPMAVSARSQGLAFFSAIVGFTAGAAGALVIVATDARDRESMVSLARDNALPAKRYSLFKIEASDKGGSRLVRNRSALIELAAVKSALLRVAWRRLASRLALVTDLISLTRGTDMV